MYGPYGNTFDMALKEFHPYIYCPGTDICTCPNIPKYQEWWVKKVRKSAVKVFPSMTAMEKLPRHENEKRMKDRKVKNVWN